MPRSRATPTVDEVPVGPEVAGSGGSVANYDPAAAIIHVLAEQATIDRSQ